MKIWFLVRSVMHFDSFRSKFFFFFIFSNGFSKAAASPKTKHATWVYWAWTVVCHYVSGVQWPGDLPRVHPASHPITYGIFPAKDKQLQKTNPWDFLHVTVSAWKKRYDVNWCSIKQSVYSRALYFKVLLKDKTAFLNPIFTPFNKTQT